MMRDCADGEMRDLLPEYVHGTLASAEHERVASHLESCEECAAEAELIRRATRAYPAPAVDLRRIVKSLPVAPRRVHSGRWLVRREWKVAAGIGVVVIGGALASSLWLRPAAPASSEHVPARVATLAAAPHSAPAPSAGRAAPPAPTAPRPAEAERTHATSPAGTSISFGGGLGDLTDEQLDTLLGEIDALDALPSAEPETHLTPIVPPGEGGHGA
jgi:Putative zinc-finger